MRTPLPPGTQLGRYEIRSQLGAGGMGEVYLALDTELERTVAIKILPERVIPDPRVLQRFIQEAKAASALNHPHILTIYEIGNTGKLAFIATEFIDGHTLRLLIKKGELALPDVLEIATQAASALEAAHAAGIVHRDVKPENIMVRRDRYVKLLDFGLAKLLQPVGTTDSSAPTKALINTDAGTVMGTATYMSPEQARGLVVDVRTDLWSLGAVIYEMITGMPPFAADSKNETISLILQKEPVPLTRFVRTVPAELERIVSKALTKDIEERYQTAKDLHIDLKRLRQRVALDAELERTGGGTADRQYTGASVGDSSITAVHRLTTQRSERPAPSSIEYVLSGIKTHRKTTAIVVLLVIAALAAVALYSYRTKTNAAIDSIAVLPFENQSRETDAEYLSDGITESVINSLTQLPNLRVVTRSTVFRYKGKQTDPVAIGKELGVGAVLTGRLLQRGDNLTISTELLDVRDNKQIWGEQYQRKLSDLLATQRDIAREIAANLRPKLFATSEVELRSSNTTDNAEAYQLYLHGRYFFRKFTPAAHQRAAQYFSEALAKDPNYALAYVGLADTYAASAANSWIPPGEGYPKAMAAVQRALAIDENLAEAHTNFGAMMMFYELDWLKAEREFKRSIELNPNYPETYELHSYMLSATGQVTEAIDVMKRGLMVAPLSLPLSDDLGQAYYWARRYDEALDQYRKSISIDAHHPGAYAGVGVVFLQKRMYREAVESFHKAIDSMDRTSTLLGLLGYTHAMAGRKTEALKILDELKQMEKSKYVSPYDLAVVYTGLGDQDRAIEQLNKAYEQRAGWIIMLKVEPIFDPLRSDPRFVELLQRLRLN